MKLLTTEIQLLLLLLYAFVIFSQIIWILLYLNDVTFYLFICLTNPYIVTEHSATVWGFLCSGDRTMSEEENVRKLLDIYETNSGMGA